MNDNDLDFDGPPLVGQRLDLVSRAEMDRRLAEKDARLVALERERREDDKLVGRLVKTLRALSEWGGTVSFVSDVGIEAIGNAKALLAELQRP